MQSTPIITCRNIKKSFVIRNKTIEVLKGIDLEVFPGEMVVIRGRSGQGKSVLQWIMSGIDTPDSGEILFGDTSYNNLPKGEMSEFRRRKIGLVFQDFNLIRSWTALENVESALLNSDLPKTEKRARAKKILEEMDMGDRLDNLPAELSVGQQQRVALARALVNGPLLLLADEPTGSVDDETAAELLDILIPYIKEKQGAMVVTTHGNFQGEHLADRNFLLRDGKLVQNG